MRAGVDELAELITSLGGPGPVSVIAIAGPVAVGKSTIASALKEVLDAQVVSTDSFLLPNSEIEAKSNLMRKGFPETYDPLVARSVLCALREGRAAKVPVYSHALYDIVSGTFSDVPPSRFVVVEGIVALQPFVRGHVDLGVYVDAPDEIVRGWFIERFQRLTTEAADDPDSFYRAFSEMTPEQVRDVAEATWDGINGPNLKEHIAPTRQAAQLVVEKGADHAIRRTIRV